MIVVERSSRGGGEVVVRPIQMSVCLPHVGAHVCMAHDLVWLPLFICLSIYVTICLSIYVASRMRSSLKLWLICPSGVGTDLHHTSPSHRWHTSKSG